MMDTVKDNQNTLQKEQFRKQGDFSHLEKYSSNRVRLQTLIYKCLKILIKLNIDMDEIAESKIFPKEPFERKNSVLFLKFVKRGNIENVIKMLDEDKYMIYQIDYKGQNV